MKQPRREFVAWIANHILIHESEVRAWLASKNLSAPMIDDVVQEVYCRLSALESVAHIVNGRAYFYKAARNILVDQARRASVVSIDLVADIEEVRQADISHSPEQLAAARRNLLAVLGLIEELPERCRRVFELRRIHGCSQREVARKLGITENVVEKQTIRGLRLLLQAMAKRGLEDVVSENVFRKLKK